MCAWATIRRNAVNDVQRRLQSSSLDDAKFATSHDPGRMSCPMGVCVAGPDDDGSSRLHVPNSWKGTPSTRTKADVVFGAPSLRWDVPLYHETGGNTSTRALDKFETSKVQTRFQCETSPEGAAYQCETSPEGAASPLIHVCMNGSVVKIGIAGARKGTDERTACATTTATAIDKNLRMLRALWLCSFADTTPGRGLAHRQPGHAGCQPGPLRAGRGPPGTWRATGRVTVVTSESSLKAQRFPTA